MWIKCLGMMPILRGIVGRLRYCKTACSSKLGPHRANFNKGRGKRTPGRGFRRNNTLFFYKVAVGLYKFPHFQMPDNYPTVPVNWDSAPGCHIVTTDATRPSDVVRRRRTRQLAPASMASMAAIPAGAGNASML